MKENQPLRDYRTELVQVGQDLDKTQSLIIKTGADHDSQAEAEKHGVRTKRANYQTYDDSDTWPGHEYGRSDRISFITDDAAITYKRDIDDHRQSKIHEKTGTYFTPKFSEEGGYIDGGVVVERPDGNGGIYRGLIGGVSDSHEEEGPKTKRATRATTIIAKRAGNRINEAVTERAISIGEELKEKRDEKG